MTRFTIYLFFISVIVPYADLVSAQVKQSNQGKYDFEYLNFPKAGYPLTNFEILNSGLPCIPMASGIYAAGVGWVQKPRGDFLLNAMARSTEDNSIYLIHSTKDSMFIVRQFPGKDKKESLKTTDIPYGFYNMVAFGKDSLFLWGLQDSLWNISYLSGRAFKTIISQKEPVTALVPLSKNSFAYSTSNEIFLVQPDTCKFRIIRSEVPIESFAFGSDGFIYLSFMNGIFRMNRSTPAEPVLAGVHGLLKSHNKNIFVLWQEKGRVVIIKPR